MARTKTEPDRAALEIAHSKLALTQPLDEVMKSKSLARTIKAVARKHIKNREKFDVKKMQAGDND